MKRFGAKTSFPRSHDPFPKGLAGQRAHTHEDPAPHGGAEIFSNSYFCNIREIKAKRVKIPIKTHLTSLVSRQSVFALRQVSGLLCGRGRLLDYRQHRARFCSLQGKGFFLIRISLILLSELLAWLCFWPVQEGDEGKEPVAGGGEMSGERVRAPKGRAFLCLGPALSTAKTLCSSSR